MRKLYKYRYYKYYIDIKGGDPISEADPQY